MNFAKILVALDHSPLDQHLIRFSHFIAQNFETATAHFIHVIPAHMPTHLLDDNLKHLIAKEFMLANREEQKIIEEVRSVFDQIEGVEMELSIIEGQPQKKLMESLEEQQPDLLVLGKKEVSGGSGIIARRIARKAKCAVCFATEKATTDLKRILVPIDFSPCSLRALKAGLHLKQRIEGLSITVLHIIDIPMTAFKVDRNKEEIIRKLQESAQRAFRNLLNKHQFNKADFELKILMNNDFNTIQYIKEVVTLEESDLIIMGAKGHSDLSSFVFGSVTEKLISEPDIPPVLIIR